MDAFTLSHALVDKACALRPVTATLLGVPGHDHRWDDFGPKGAARWSALLEDTQRALGALDPPSDRWQRLAARCLGDWCHLEQDRLRAGDHLLDLNSIASSFQFLRMAFDVMDTRTPEGWENVCARLRGLPEACATYREGLAEGLSRGLSVAARQVRAALHQGRQWLAPEGFFQGLPGALRRSGVASAVLEEKLQRALPTACTALEELLAWLEHGYLPRSSARDAVGRERYLREARRFLGDALDPEDTYAWGWREVRELQRAMANTAGGILPGRTLPEVLQAVKAPPFPVAPTMEAFLAVMRERQARALSELDGVHFDIPAPLKTLEVRRAPAGGSLGAYYLPPSEDFSRPGAVWYARQGDGPVALYDEVSTAYHEGFPGHHLQVGTQVALTEKLSRFQRLWDGYAGYAEGWALYAERLMGELGYYEEPAYVLGMQSNQLIRALRVVVDLGLHLELPIPADAPFHPGEPWSYALAVEVLRTHGGLAPDRAESEVTRYLGWPAQAISYKCGERVLLQLRDALRARDGDRFSPRAFHARVLDSGPVGLGLLRELVLEG
ncbi:MAG: DUF885 domain-containing protein [Deltaproteobacteria bacterium]|nr:DUF885 domain-containing protein [Deltaproteobacteria bacterium]